MRKTLLFLPLLLAMACTQQVPTHIPDDQALRLETRRQADSLHLNERGYIRLKALNTAYAGQPRDSAYVERLRAIQNREE